MLKRITISLLALTGSLGCAAVQPPTWTARVTATPCGNGFTGSYSVLLPNGASSTNTVSGVVSCSGPQPQWVEYSVGAGARILSAAFVNSSFATELKAELRRNDAVVSFGSTTTRGGMVAISAP